MSISENLGAVSAYAVAVRNGFVGTEAEWEEAISKAAMSEQYAETAQAAAESAAQSAEIASQHGYGMSVSNHIKIITLHYTIDNNILKQEKTYVNIFQKKTTFLKWRV